MKRCLPQGCRGTERNERGNLSPSCRPPAEKEERRVERQGGVSRGWGPRYDEPQQREIGLPRERIREEREVVPDMVGMTTFFSLPNF